MLSRLKITALALALSATLSACASSGSDGAGGAPATATSPTVTLTVKVTAAPGAPDDFGLVPGNAIAGANVQVDTAVDGTPQVATTDESGTVVLMIQSGSYLISATKDTHDPDCRWHESTEIEVGGSPVTVELDELWVQCE